MKTLGRILVRSDNITGLFIPFGDNSMEPGIYELREVMGEKVIVRIGYPATPMGRLSTINLDEVLDDTLGAILTRDEFDTAST